MHVYKGLVILFGTALSLACSSGGGYEGEKGGGNVEPQAAPAGQNDEASKATEANITPEMISLGESIFKGKTAGGICYTCHGQDAKGTPTGPNLTDNEWIHGNGSTAGIAKVIRDGVTNPKKFSSPMPRFGKQFNDEQVQALSAYVYSLSHPSAGGQQQQQQPAQEEQPQQPPQEQPPQPY